MIDLIDFKPGSFGEILLKPSFLISVGAIAMAMFSTFMVLGACLYYHCHVKKMLENRGWTNNGGYNHKCRKNSIEIDKGLNNQLPSKDQYYG